jgi:hypothetical protein
MWKTAAAIAVGAAILCVPAGLNGFPFVFPDSGDYLVFTPRLYRSPFYGLFAFFLHWNTSVWPIVAGQAVIASALIRIFLSRVAGITGAGPFLGCILVLTCLSSAPIFAGFIMADFFTAALILSFTILLLRWSVLTHLELGFTILVLCIALVAHVTHLALGLGLLMAILAVAAAFRLPVPLLRPAMAAVAALVLAASAVLLNNAVIHRTIGLAPAGAGFQLANLIQEGPAYDYLVKACPTRPYRICAYLDLLPRSSDAFLWFPKHGWEVGGPSIMQELGGFAAIREEAAEIVIATIETYPERVAGVALRNAVLPLWAHRIGRELRPQHLTVPSLLALFEEKFGSETKAAYLSSLQGRGLVPIATIDVIGAVSLVISLAIAVWSMLRDGSTLWRVACLSVLAGIAGNWILCSVFGSGIFDRHYTRVSWLLVLLAVAGILRWARRDGWLREGSGLSKGSLRQ